MGCPECAALTLGMNVANGARIFLLYISAQISYPPSIHKFLYVGAHEDLLLVAKKKETRNKDTEKNAPKRPGSFDDDLFLGIREATD